MLNTIWFLLWGLIWAVYFVLDGFDLGLGTLHPVIARNEKDKKTVYHAMGPFWNGNEVWLITAGGVTFAAFPTAYAVLFSSFYAPLMMILFALIIRGISLEFREHSHDRGWKKIWDFGTWIGSAIPAILFGVAFANIFQGIPIDGEGRFHGTLLTLLNPYGLLGGILFCLLFSYHGLLWLLAKVNEGELRERTLRMARTLWVPLVLSIVAFLIATWFKTDLYRNYLENPIFYSVPAVIIPAAVVGGLVASRYYLGKPKRWLPWICSAVMIIGTTFFGILGLYPNLLPSSIDPRFSLTAFNASSSPLTLKIMLTVVLIFVPIVIAYQLWTYRLFAYPITDDEMAKSELY
ncbi:cytochrome d ubiquinol oxidase subunit II [Thermodesulforhabdus norvegica]|uniref:Cytochrome bd-I ubiquinol oxidase subunit 2 apoprotein n=1 Tax=Thermodesulforhabdus norvegica TaxID=39841 RepID=A0A1I4VY87_9BACT|nr:cytochrome d ubiquinol oxidase subunit II [Thermodesulforhabdus norvegica]SFN06284.1 cytochrome bd-I ubiquinol oxidase subunit 2 apoprotein [Thermodesulforhabdus norvegica]